MNKISMAEHLFANKANKLASPIIVEEKWEFVSSSLLFLFFDLNL